MRILVVESRRDAGTCRRNNASTQRTKAATRVQYSAAAERTNLRESILIGGPTCQPEVISRSIDRNNSVFAISDKYPVTPGHLHVLPMRHVPDIFSMNEAE